MTRDEFIEGIKRYAEKLREIPEFEEEEEESIESAFSTTHTDANGRFP